MRVSDIPGIALIEIVSCVSGQYGRRVSGRAGANVANGDDVARVNVVIESIHAIRVGLRIACSTEVLGCGCGRIGGLRRPREEREKRLVYCRSDADEIGRRYAAGDCLRGGQLCPLVASEEEKLVLQHRQAGRNTIVIKSRSWPGGQKLIPGIEDAHLVCGSILF